MINTSVMVCTWYNFVHKVGARVEAFRYSPSHRLCGQTHTQEPTHILQHWHNPHSNYSSDSLRNDIKVFTREHRIKVGLHVDSLTDTLAHTYTGEAKYNSGLHTVVSEFRAPIWTQFISPQNIPTTTPCSFIILHFTEWFVLEHVLSPHESSVWIHHINVGTCWVLTPSLTSRFTP